MLIDPVAAQRSLSEEEKSAVNEQLERLLSNPHFSHSRRFPSFLRFVIDHTLAGQTDSLKERTLGIEIFGRDANYDTASDPIVRVTAAEIRKRIAQYYQEPGHEGELRVSLPAGSYVPQFHWPRAAELPKNGAEAGVQGSSEVLSSPVEPSGATALVVAASEEITSQPEEPAVRRRTLHRSWVFAATAVILLCLSTGLFLWRSTHHSAFDFFWDPLLNTGDPVLFCIADQSQYAAEALRDADDPARQTVLKDSLTAIVIDDLSPVLRIAGVLQSRGKKYVLKGEQSTNLLDLRNGPTIFIGAFDNAWTLRLTRPLRYHFANNPEMTEFSIVDSSTPGRRWVVNRVLQMKTNNYRDFAIVARFTDPTTGKLAVVAAGVGRGGTIVSGEFLTDPAHLAALQRAALQAGNKKNMEVVLSTRIIDGEPGTPNIEATYFW